uniref:Uncharacterized protein n=1 Tax=Tanacetum cinerariifolium TaxID=118510 RepID=A0A6L2NWL0_TANCI|nr:hypothetical protein [Tanacetum cinerariifolium]
MIPEPGDANREINPEWSRHVIIVHQTKDLHIADYTQLYDFLKYNQKEVDELKAEILAKTQDPLALMANSNNPYVFPAPHQDQSSFNKNYLQQPMLNPEDITDPTTTMNMALALMVKAFKLNYLTPTNNNQRISSNPRNRQIAQPGQNAGNLAGYNDIIGNQVIQNAVQNPRVQNVGNQNGLIGVQGNGNQNQIRSGNLVVARAKGNAAGQNGNQIRCYNCRGVEEYDLMVAAADLDEIEELNANCILMANLQQASTLGTQTDSAPVYDTDRSAEVYENCDDNEIFNMFTQEEQYTELLEPIPESHQVPQYDNDVISKDFSVEQGREIVEQHPAHFEETRALYESLYQSLAIEVEKVNSVNRNHYPLCHLAILCHHPHAYDLESYLTISPSTYALLLDGFDNDVSFEEEVIHQRLRKTLTHVLELSSCIYLDDRPWGVLNFDSAGMRMNLRRTSVTGFLAQSSRSSDAIATDSPYLLVLNTGASQSRQHEVTLQLAQESRDKMKQMNKEIKPANYTKINHLSGVFVP